MLLFGTFLIALLSYI
ncbi:MULTISPECIES: hypothetical protein, partial [Lactobacillaceae]